MEGGYILKGIRDDYGAYIISGSAVCALIAVISALLMGITLYITQLLFIPIILGGYRYPRRSIFFASILGTIYLTAVLLFVRDGMYPIILAIGQVAMLIVIAAFVGYLAENLQSEKARYKSVVEDQMDMILRFRPDGTNVFANQAYCDYFDQPSEEIVGSKNHHTIHSQDRHLVEAFFAALTPENPAGSIDYRVIMPDGSVCWQAWNCRAICDASGSLVEYQAVGHDITEKILANRALTESEKRYRAIFENSGTAMVIVNSNGTICLANAEAESLFGYSPEELVRMVRWQTLIPECEYQKIWHLFHPWIAGNDHVIRHHEADLLDRWGNTKHGLLTLANIEDTDKLFVSIVDITEKKRTDRIISVINKISQLLMYEKDTEYLFMAVCQEFRALKHQFVAAVALCAGEDLVPVAISDDAYEYLNAACLGSTWVREALRESFMKMPVESELRGNTDKTVTAYAFPMHNSDEPRGILMMYALTEADLNHNELESLQALAHDIASAIKSLELETQKRVALEQIEENMSQLAILNDNIRNPLQTMVGWADLEGGKLADIVIEQANEINDIVKRLDQGWIESEKIREFLRKHYNIERNGKL